MDVLGLDEVAKAMNHLKKRYQEAMAVAVYLEAASVMSESLKQVPVDSGRLRQSHYVAPPNNLDDPAAMAGYGAEYGIEVHERTDLKHSAPGKDHFLADPLVQATEGYTERVAKRIEKAMAVGMDRAGLGTMYPKVPKQ